MSIGNVCCKIPEDRKIMSGFGSSRRKDLDLDLEREVDPDYQRTFYGRKV